MARKKSYGTIIAEHIAQIVIDRQIDHVLHFTRLENFPNILRHGLRARSELVEADFDAFASAAGRLDENDEAVSVSISCYYPRMFEAKRYSSGGNPWAILVLDPSLLWERHCLFFRRGAPTNEMKYEGGKKYGGYALRRLFEDCSPSMDFSKTGFRAEAGLPPSWPTFSDSEVQVMSSISSGYIRGVWVEAAEHGEFVRAAFAVAKREECNVVIHPFVPRISYKQYYWG